MESKVSVIIPVYNAKRFLRETLDSVLAQTYTNWEIIAVDDHSSDSSVKILEEYTGRDSRIKFYIRDKEQKGGSVCRNIGISKATGEYIVFLDSDDLLCSFCLEQRVKMMTGKQTGFAVFPMHSFKITKEQSELYTKLDKKEHLFHFIATHCIWSIHCVIWKKDTLLDLGGFNEKYPRLQDTEIHLRALLSGISYSVNADLPFDCYYRIVKKENEKHFLHDVLIAYRMYVEEVMSYYKQTNVLSSNPYSNHALKALPFIIGFFYFPVDRPVPFVKQIFDRLDSKFLYYILQLMKFFQLNKIHRISIITCRLLEYCFYREINKVP